LPIDLKIPLGSFMSERPASAAPSVSSANDTLNDAAIAAANPHYAHLGGHDAVVRLVDAFYAQMDQRPEARLIRTMHPSDLSPVKHVLVRYLSEWLGGPQQYSEERGHPRLRRRHLPFRIGAAERDAWLLCMRAALDATCADTVLRRELDTAFTRTADFIRNDAGTTHSPHGSHHGVPHDPHH
jgi:hemoglobin